jgi:hypothetical protein
MFFDPIKIFHVFLKIDNTIDVILPQEQAHPAQYLLVFCSFNITGRCLLAVLLRSFSSGSISQKWAFSIESILKIALCTYKGCILRGYEN